MFSSITIGDGGDYGTIPLWQVARRNNIVDNKVNDELTLLSGTYNHTGSLFWYWPGNEGFSASVIIQAHPSALHNGDWDSGVCISGSTDWWKVQRNDLNITYRDIVLKKAKVKIDQTNNYFGSIFGTDWDMSSVHHCKLTFDRCMVYTEGSNHTEPDYYSYTPSSNPSAFGTVEVNYNNCVLEDTIGAVYPSNGTIRPGYSNAYGDHTYNFKGCTLIKQSFRRSQSITSLGTSASLTVNVSGCIEDTSGTGTGPGTPAEGRPTLIGGHPMNIGYYPGGVGFPSNLSATLTDHITNQASGNVYDWATTKTNVSYAVPFTFDGTVTNGEVGFVDNQGASSFRDYRLVADLDNLAVQYAQVRNDAIPNADVAGTHRPNDTDAGAFQSVSNETYSAIIGTGDGATHATYNIWRGTRYPDFLNGDTDIVTFQEGNVPDAYMGIGDPFGNEPIVDRTLKINGAPHNGDWNSGTIVQTSASTRFVIDERTNLGHLYTGDHNLTLEFNDMVFNHSTGSQPVNYNVTLNNKNDRKLTFNRCMIFANNANPINHQVLGNNYNIDSITGEKDFGTVELHMNNCVADNPQLSGIGAFVPGYSDYLRSIVQGGPTYSNYKAVVNGCSLFGGTIDAGRREALNAGATIELEANGNIYLGPSADNNFTNGGGLFQTVYLYGSHVGNSNFSGTSTDNIFANYENNQDWITTSSNNTFSAEYNYDGTVTNGEVTFVDNSGASAYRDYRLVADENNLAVRYMDLSNALSKDITGYARPGSTDAGAFQSISTNVSSFEIGASDSGHIKDGAYATVSLWYTNERDSLLNGDTVNLEFLSGAPHSIGGPDYDSFNEVNFNLKFKPASSAIHNGNWDEGVALEMNTGNFFLRLGDQSVKFEIEDLILSSLGNFSLILRNTNATPSSCGAYSFDFKQNKCLLATSRWNSQAAFGFETRDSLGNLTEVGSYTFTLENCVSDSPESYFTYFGPLHDHQCNVTYNFIGSTIWRRTGIPGYGLTRISTNSAKGVDSTLTHTFKGFLSNFDLTHFNSLNSSPNSQNKIYNVTDSILNSYTLSATTQPNWSGTYNFHNFTDTRFSGSFDGTVTSGQVNFVDNGGVTALRDFRLVPDLDNLPVKYMTSGELSYKDITGYKRPGGTDQRDAGAYQSISDQTLINKIGTSSVDFDPDYASMNLWRTNEFNNLNVLNGTTHVLQLKSGETHRNQLFRIDMDSGDRNVNQSFILSGQNPHNGNWDDAANLDIEPNSHTLSIATGKNSFDFKYKDLVVNASSVTSTQPRLLSHTATGTNGGDVAPEHHFIYENFMVHYPKTSRQFLLVMNNNYGAITDEDSNIIERGESRSTHKNCLYIGASAGGTNYAGSISLYTHQYGTAASAVFDLQGCTLINSFLSNGRHGVQNDQLKVSAIGCLYYASPTHLNQFGRQMTLLGPNSIAAGRDIDQNIQASKNVKVFDCIFNNGAADSIGAENYQDRYSTWVIEPLPSEYNDSTSASVESVEPWNVWASSLSGTTFRTSYNFDGTTSPSTVSFESSATKDYRLAWSPDNLAVQYVANADMPETDIAGRTRGGEDNPDAGAYELYPDLFANLAFGNVYINLYN